jgi:hypothetical protein
MLLMAVSAVPASATQPTPAGWPQNGLGADRTGYQPNETVINTSNVATLSESRTYESGQAIASAPLIWNGDLYDHIGNTLDAFDATGVTDCSCALHVHATPGRPDEWLGRHGYRADRHRQHR